ncbi:MAG: hypothetical protein K0A93_00365 [Desulfuromonadaceae bacterium]|nr:hypothetical protein [Desulfuromonadaceae bacterium]
MLNQLSVNGQQKKVTARYKHDPFATGMSLLQQARPLWERLPTIAKRFATAMSLLQQARPLWERLAAAKGFPTTAKRFATGMSLLQQARPLWERLAAAKGFPTTIAVALVQS